jgi:hypothetical protein
MKSICLTISGLLAISWPAFAQNIPLGAAQNFIVWTTTDNFLVTTVAPGSNTSLV